VESMQGLGEGEEEPEIPAPTTLPKAGLRIRMDPFSFEFDKYVFGISNSRQFSVPYKKISGL
jgi:hypothetical protein